MNYERERHLSRQAFEKVSGGAIDLLAHGETVEIANALGEQRV